jgi:hypothetical protein
MEIRTALVAHGEAAERGQPGPRALHDPAVPAQACAARAALAGKAARDSPAPQGDPTGRAVIRLVGVPLVRTLAGPSAGPLDRRDASDERGEDAPIRAMRRPQSPCERDAVALDHKGALAARFAALRRMRSGFRAPLLAGAKALSALARLQARLSALPNRSKNAGWRRSHTPARCHARRRRQRVTLLPQPLSWGSISPGMPLVSTKRMPVKAARSGTRGRPPLGLGGSGGKSGALVSHSVSLTNGLLIRPGHAAGTVPGF